MRYFRWFCAVSAYLFAFQGVIPGAASRADAGEVWRGMVVIHGGTVSGSWKDPSPAGVPVVADPPEAWRAREAQLRGVPADVWLEPDGNGRSSLTVAHGAGLRGKVVDLRKSDAQIRGAAVTDTLFLSGGRSAVYVRDSWLSSVHFLSPGSGMEIDIKRCAISGPFGAGLGSGLGLKIEETHFTGSRLPEMAVVPGMPPGMPRIRRCRFERCYVPYGFLRHCSECVFRDCVFGEEPPADAGARGFPRRIPVPGTVPNVLHEEQTPADPETAAPWRFWIPWDGIRLAGRMASSREVQPVFLAEGASRAAPGENLFAGGVYRGLEAAEQLQFANNKVNSFVGSEMARPADLSHPRPDQVIWEDTARTIDLPDKNGRFHQYVRSSLVRHGFLSPDRRLLGVLDRVDGTTGRMLRLYEMLPENLDSSADPAARVLGTTWRIETPEMWLIRFESTGRLVWRATAGSGRGQCQWRPGLAPDQIFVENGPAGRPATLKISQESDSLVMTAGDQEWKGRLLKRDQPGDFAPLGQGYDPKEKGGPEAADAGSSGTPAAPAASRLGKDASSPSGSGGMEARSVRMHGLLVAELPGGKLAGAASLMNAVAISSAFSGEASLQFNQNTGPLMTKALEEVRKFMTVRHGGWLQGCRIELSFADKYTPKDGPSAAAACALLLEGLYTGDEWDARVAVTGDLNADGSVQPVGGVPAKIRGAASSQCDIIGVPERNRRAVRDCLISEGPQMLLKSQIFALKEFDEARDLASIKNRPASVQTALTEFDKVIRAAPAPQNAAAWLKQAAVMAQLKKVTAAAPHHLSAALLLEYAASRTPLTLSLGGSVDWLDREAYDLLQAIRAASMQDENLAGIRQDRLGDIASRLMKARTRLHPETRPLLDSMSEFTAQARTHLNNPPRTPVFRAKAVETLGSAASRISAQYDSLRAKPEVMEELMRE